MRKERGKTRLLLSELDPRAPARCRRDTPRYTSSESSQRRSRKRFELGPPRFSSQLKKRHWQTPTKRTRVNTYEKRRGKNTSPRHKCMILKSDGGTPPGAYRNYASAQLGHYKKETEENVARAQCRAVLFPSKFPCRDWARGPRFSRRRAVESGKTAACTPPELLSRAWCVLIGAGEGRQVRGGPRQGRP